jgi:hypothetical protein
VFFAIVWLAGVTAIELRVAVVTVNVVESLNPPKAALIVVVPAAIPVARPALEIVAMPDAVVPHVAEDVRSCVEPSENTPVAVNWSVVDFAICGVTGEITRSASTALVTVSVVESLSEPSVALIVVVPAATPVATPPAVIVAVAVDDEAHVTAVVSSCWVPSLNVAVAVSAWVVPFAMDGNVGLTEIETSTAGPIVRFVEPTMLPSVALIVVVPWATPVATPPDVIVPAAVDEAHVTLVVRFCVEPSE